MFIMAAVFSQKKLGFLQFLSKNSRHYENFEYFANALDTISHAQFYADLVKFLGSIHDSGPRF